MEFWFDTAEVIVYRQGRKVVLGPVDEWPDEFRALLGSWPHKIPRPKQWPAKRRARPLRLMSGFLLGTDTVSFAPRGEGQVAERLLSHPRSKPFVSSLTLAELRFGAENSR